MFKAANQYDSFQMKIIDTHKKIYSIQLIRAFSALTISISHIPFVYLNGWNLVFGVDIFLILTAFLEMYTIENYKNFYIFEYLKRKLLRIIPLYWSITLITFIVANIYINVLGHIPTISELFKSLLFIPYTKISNVNESLVIRPIVGPAHTLMYDVYFYFVYGLSTKMNFKKRGIISSIILITILILGRTIGKKNIYLIFYSNYWVIDFVFGILLFYLYKMYNNDHINLKFYFFNIMISLIVFLLVSHVNIHGPMLILFKTIPGFIFIISTIRFFTYIKIPTFFIKLGDISYSYYLIHYYFLVFFQLLFCSFKEINMKSVIFSILALLFAEITAYFSWKIIEQKIGLLLKNKLIYM